MKRRFALLPSLLAGAALAASAGAQAASLTVTGAGATFPYPLYSKWFYEYSRSHPEVNFNYQSIGSGGGVRQIVAGTVDFGASDAPMTDEELSRAPGPILHVPTVAGAVAVVYHLPGIGSGLKLTPQVLTDIYLGRIARWNDPRIAALNPGLALPGTAVVVTHRSDGSGTTDIFTNYLSTISLEWRAKVGRGKAISWPAGLGGKGNEGVAGLVRQTPGAIGYVELAYAMQNRMAVAALRNREGHFVVPTLESTTAAMSGAAAAMPADFRATLVDPPGKDAYPICGLTWILIYENQRDRAKGKALVDFLKWAIRDGQRMAAPLFYAPLPRELADRVDRALRRIRYGTEALY